jgi:hypothetical protein
VRVLLDESLPSGLKGLLQGLDVTTVPERGWRGVKNGDLLDQASREFDVFLTADQNLEYQQNLSAVGIAIVVLVAATNRLDAYKPMVDRIRQALETARPGVVTKVAA